MGELLKIIYCFFVMFKLFTPCNIKEKFNLLEYFNRKLLSGICKLNQFKKVTVKSNYQNKEKIKKMMRIKKSSLFAFSRINSIIHEFRYALYVLGTKEIALEKK